LLAGIRRASEAMPGTTLVSGLTDGEGGDRM
jgi:hypothetical protein